MSEEKVCLFYGSKSVKYKDKTKSALQKFVKQLIDEGYNTFCFFLNDNFTKIADEVVKQFAKDNAKIKMEHYYNIIKNYSKINLIDDITKKSNILKTLVECIGEVVINNCQCVVFYIFNEKNFDVLNVYNYAKKQGIKSYNICNFMYEEHYFD